MKTLIGLVGLALVATALVVLWIRFSPNDPARWHVDPTAAPDPTSPNFARSERNIALPPAEVAARIEAAARREGAVVLAQDGDLTTWVARTRLMKYPDMVSIRLDPTETGTRVTAFSRSRFGYGDGGVNAARLQRWIGRIEP